MNLLPDSHDGKGCRSLEERLYAAMSFAEAEAIAAEARSHATTDLQRAEVSVEFGWCLYDGFGRQQEALDLGRSALTLSVVETKSPRELLLRARAQFLVASCLWSADYGAAAEAAGLALQLLEDLLAENQEGSLQDRALWVKALVHEFLGQTQEEMCSLEMRLKLPLDGKKRQETSLLHGWRLHYGASDPRSEALQSAQACLRSLPADTDDVVWLTLRGECEQLVAYCTWPHDPAAALKSAGLALKPYAAVLERSVDGYYPRLAHRGAVLSHIFLDESEAAARCYERLLQLPQVDRNRSEASVHYALLLAGDLGRPEEAVERAKAALSLIPDEDDSPDEQDLRGLAEFVVAHSTPSSQRKVAMEAAQRGLRNFERVLVRNPNGATAVGILENMVWLHAQLREREEALRTADRCLEIAPTDLYRGILSIRFGQGLHDSLGVCDEALNLVRQGLRLLPEETEGDSILMARANGCWVIAESICSTDPDQSAEAARSGLKVCERILARGPAPQVEQNASRLAANFHLELDQAEESARCLRRCLELESSPRKRLHLTYELGKALRIASDWGEATRMLHEALKNIDADRSLLPYVQYQIGVVELQTERLANAKETFRQAAEVLQAGAALGERDARDDGFKDWEGAIQLQLGHTFYQLGQYEEALTAYQQAVAACPDGRESCAGALLWQGYCHHSLGAFAQARICLEDLLTIEHIGPEDRESAEEGIRQSRWSAAEAHREAGRLREAAVEYETLVSLYPDDETRCGALLWLARCQVLLWRRTDARKTYERVLASEGATSDQREHAREALRHTGPVAWVRRWLTE